MKFTSELENLLAWGIPNMTDDGEQLFRRMMEDAIKGVIVQAFDERELDSFHVKQMTK